LLNTELALLYEARAQGAEPSLPRTPSLQYADYATWQRQKTRPDGPYFNEVISWWKSLISTASPTVIRLPFKRLIRRSGLDPNEGVLKWKLEERTAQRLDQFARSVGATLFTVRLAVFAVLVADVTGNSTIIIGTNFASRNHAETENIVGPLGHLGPLVFSYDASKTFREWLGMVRDRVFETGARSELPYEVVKQRLRAEGIEPLEIEIVFAMLGDHSDEHFGNLTISHEFRRVGKMPWGCQFFLDSEKPENCCVHFDAGVYDRNQMRVMLDRYLTLLEAAAREPELPLMKLLIIAGSRPLRWTCANYAAPFYKLITAFYASSPLLKMCWRPIRRWVLSES
jgi:hypothetical protein